MNRTEQIKQNEDVNDKIALAMQHLFGSKNGIVVLDDLRQFCGYEISSVGQDYDVNKVMFREGQRNVYVHIDKMLKRKVEKNE